MAGQTSVPAAVLTFQGVVNTAFGAFGIFRPANLADAFGGTMPRAAAYALSLQLLNMGVLTLFAATRPDLHRWTLIARICLHLLAGYLFWQEGAHMRSAAITDIAFAALNAITTVFL